MNGCVFFIVLLHLSLTTAVHFTEVSEWPDGMDYYWTNMSKWRMTTSQGNFAKDKIAPIFMAVYGQRIFLTLDKLIRFRILIPETLVTLPTNCACSKSLNLVTFPPGQMQGLGQCHLIQVALGMQVDSDGRLWVLDNGSESCTAKLWIIDLSNNDHTELVHQFSYYDWMHDFVLDETPNGTLAYISNYLAKRIIVFSLERKESWIVNTTILKSYAIAISPKDAEPRLLYVSTWNNNDLFSISVDALRNGTQFVNPTLIGKWSGKPYRMLIDSHGIMYAAFWHKSYIHFWNTSQPFEEQHFYEAEYMNTKVPFTFALDSWGTFWMTELKNSTFKPRIRLIKATDSAKPYYIEYSKLIPKSETVQWATTDNFEHVFEWPDGMDYEWPSEEKRIQALEAGALIPENIEPLFMVVYGSRIFLSLVEKSIPVTLVSLPTSSASSASPKLTPFPSWDIHRKGNCLEKIEEARGLQVDSVGRLWVLDSGSGKCNAKLWFIDLSNMDQTELIHEFQYRGYTHMNDFVLDETPNGTLAYIVRGIEQHIIVFSLERKQSWLVGTPGMNVSSIALSPKEEARQLYLGKYNSNELFSISVDALRKGTRIANPKLIGKWSVTHSYIMKIDNHGTMYAAFWKSTKILSWNTSQLFQEQRFHEIGNQGLLKPFTFAVDSWGIFWMTQPLKTATFRKERYRLLVAAVEKRNAPYTQIPELNHITPVALSFMRRKKSSSPEEEPATTKMQECSSILTEKLHQSQLLTIILISVIVLSSLINLWFILRPKRNNLSRQNTNAAMHMSVSYDNNEDIGPAEEQFEEVTYEIGSPSHPLRLVPTSRRFVSARDLSSESDASEDEDVEEIRRGTSCSSRE